MYKASLVFEFVTWSIILVFTLAQASAVTAKCESIQLQVCCVGKYARLAAPKHSTSYRAS